MRTVEEMKVTKAQLRKIIISEIKVLMDDTLIPPSEVNRKCPRCGVGHSGKCSNDHEHGRNLSYGSVKSDDREGRMTRSHLYKISKYSQSLHDLLRDDDDLPEWVQSKIARAADKMQSVHGYIDYKLNRMDRR
tara:strand:+ start:130 stop:528 length:399 start_codon:yes stop_codon:yes gene_type:complete